MKSVKTASMPLKVFGEFSFMKKFFGIIFSVLLLFSLPTATANAETKNVAAFGDSLTYGYGVDGESYAKIYADEKGYSFANYAEVGMDSQGLKELLKTDAPDYSEADEIILWIGANDLLHALYEYADEKGIDYDNIKNESVDNIKNQLNSEEFNEKMRETVKTFEKNLVEILEILRGNGGNCRIYLFTQYNPYDGIIISGINIGNIADKWVRRLNNVIAEREGVVIVDAYFVVRNSQEKCVNADVDLNFGRMDLDPHLTAEGHREISAYFKEISARADAAEAAGAETDPPADTGDSGSGCRSTLIGGGYLAAITAAGCGAIVFLRKKKGSAS